MKKKLKLHVYWFTLSPNLTVPETHVKATEPNKYKNTLTVCRNRPHHTTSTISTLPNIFKAEEGTKNEACTQPEVFSREG